MVFLINKFTCVFLAFLPSDTDFWMSVMLLRVTFCGVVCIQRLYGLYLINQAWIEMIITMHLNFQQWELICQLLVSLRGSTLEYLCHGWRTGLARCGQICYASWDCFLVYYAQQRNFLYEDFSHRKSDAQIFMFV